MALTGTAFLALVVLVAVGAFVAVVVFWPRLARGTVVRVASRVGMLLVTNLSVLLVVAVVMNDQFGFYADWTDLSSSLTGATPTTTRQSGTTPHGAFGSAPLATTAARRLPPLPAGQGPGGRLLRYTVTGARSRLTGEVLVWLPASYRGATSSRRSYPVLETFPGFPGGPGQWLGSMGLGTALDQAAAQNRIGQTLVVSPTVELPAGQDTECVNGRTAVETWATQDVPAWLQAHFRVAPDRRAWSTIGLSAGGWCAAMATMLHPRQYGAAVVMGGYFHPEFFGTPPFTKSSAAARRYDLVRLARTSPPAIAMWLETSHADRLSFSTSAALLKAVHAPMSVHAVILAHAGHRISVWQALLPDALGWLGTNVPGFAPGTVLTARSG